MMGESRRAHTSWGGKTVIASVPYSMYSAQGRHGQAKVPIKQELTAAQSHTGVEEPSHSA